MPDVQPLHFIGEPIEARFEKAPARAKTPHCPDGFAWRGRDYRVVELLGEWRDYGRRGRFAANMQEHNLRKAVRRGSWGVGRFYFRVFVDSGQIFDLYYDRAPKDVDNRLGNWFLYRELEFLPPVN